MDYDISNKNDTFLEETCQEPLYSDKDFLNTIRFLIGLLFMLILCRLEQRKGCDCCRCCCCCCRRCGMIVAVNFLENKEDRAMVICAFILMTNIIIESIVGDVIKGSSPILKMILKIIMVFIICVASFPLFATIGMESKWSQLLGIIYTGIFVTVDFLAAVKFCQEIPVEASESYITLVIYTPAALYLILSYIKRIYNISKGKNLEFHYLWNRYQIDYIRSLLQSPSKNPSSVCEIKRKNWSGIKKLFIFKISGFRYSLLILISVCIGFVAIAVLLIQTIILTTWLYQMASSILMSLREEKFNFVIPNFIVGIAGKLLKKKVGSSLAGGISIVDLVIDQINIIFWCNILSGSLSFLLACITFILMLISHKRVVLKMRKKMYQSDGINLDIMNPVSLVVSATQFGGYQVAHIIWGFMLQWIVLFLIFFVIGEILILPMIYANFEFFLVILEFFMPYAIVIILTIIIQRILVKKCFLQDNGNTLALKNRKSFYNMMYFMFFYNILMGFIGCFLRMIKSIVLGLWYFPRLDRSIFPKSFESLDSGFVAYICLIKLEDIQSNNILRIFIYLLLHRREPFVRHYSTAFALADELLASKLRRQLLMKHVRNRWFLLWTLLHNPELSKLRKQKTTRKTYYFQNNKNTKIALISNMNTNFDTN